MPLPGSDILPCCLRKMREILPPERLARDYEAHTCGTLALARQRGQIPATARFEVNHEGQEVFVGHSPSACRGEHRPLGWYRAYCEHCSTYCYASGGEAACPGCQASALETRERLTLAVVEAAREAVFCWSSWTIAPGDAVLATHNLRKALDQLDNSQPPPNA